MSIVSKLRQVLEGKRKVVESVNTKAGSTLPDTCKWDTLSETIDNISTGIETDDATATASDILKDKVAYGKEGRLVGAIETYDGASDVGEATPNTLKNLLDNTKNASYLFYKYYGDISELLQYNDTENVNNFSYSFFDSRDINYKVNTDKMNRCDYMFYGSMLAIKIDISNFTSSATQYNSSWCASCNKLKALIIRSFGTKRVLNSTAFSNCYWLLGQTNAQYNPNGEQGYIYVPRDMISILQNETNWSTMQFRALEDYTKDGTTTGEFDDEKAGI